MPSCASISCSRWPVSALACRSFESFTSVRLANSASASSKISAAPVACARAKVAVRFFAVSPTYLLVVGREIDDQQVDAELARDHLRRHRLADAGRPGEQRRQSRRAGEQPCRIRHPASASGVRAPRMRCGEAASPGRPAPSGRPRRTADRPRGRRPACASGQARADARRLPPRSAARRGSPLRDLRAKAPASWRCGCRPWRRCGASARQIAAFEATPGSGSATDEIGHAVMGRRRGAFVDAHHLDRARAESCSARPARPRATPARCRCRARSAARA